jgi:hypothetical protein
MAGAHPRVLIVFVDALGPAQLRRFGDRLGALPHRRALRGVLGYSSGALPTLLTGAPPAVHGRMCLFSKRRAGAPSLLAPLSWLGLLPRVVHERGALRRALARALAAARGLTGYVALHRVPPEAFRWLDLPEREDLFQAERIGPARTFLADARRAGRSVYTAEWQLPEGERWAAAEEQLARERPDLSFLYATELDGELHKHGHRDAVIEGVSGRLAARVERAREILGEDGSRLTTIVVGDHGMVDVSTVIDPRPLLAAMDIEQVFVDSTMMRFWGGEPSLSRARRALSAAGIGGRWLDPVDLSARKAPTEGAPFGEALWLLPEGSIFAPSFLGGRLRGMHGYDLGEPSSFAALASDDAGVLDAASIADLAGIVRARLGLPEPDRGSAQRAEHRAGTT